MAKNPAAAAALADAFASLTVEGKPVTVRALRERAKVGTEAAREWLATNRPAREVSPAPQDVLARLIDPLWSAAVAAARDEESEQHAAERDALAAAEAAALDEVAATAAERDAEKARADRAEADAATLRDQLAELRDRLAAAEKARDDEAARTQAARDDLEAARQAAHAAELTAAEAQATTRTLREVIDQQQMKSMQQKGN